MPPVGIQQMPLLNHDLRSVVSDLANGLKMVDLHDMGAKNRRQITRLATSVEMIVRLLDSAAAREPESNVRLADILEHVKNRWQGRAEELGVAVSFDMNISESACIAGPRVDVERILSNLLDNAFKHSPPNGRVVFSAMLEPACVTFCISDEGPGFSKEARNVLFTFRGRPEGSEFPGSGMGLYIVRRLVEKLQGKVRVNSPPKGAQIEVVLPLVSQAPEPANLDLPLDGVRILLAEDNETNQIVAVHMLQSLGAEVTVASEGMQAWQMLQEQTFDLALLDIEMPRKNGLDLIRDIRAMGGPFAGMPIVVVTAYFMREQREQVFAAGADGLITKPLMSIKNLGAELQKYCQPALGTPQGAPVDAAVFDGLKRTVGADGFAGFLVKLLDDFYDVQSGLERGLAEKSVDDIRSASHVLISLSGAVGASGLLQAAQSLNKASHGDTWEKVAQEARSNLDILEGLIGYLDFVRSKYAGG